jgi:hypothetical protein
VPKLTVAAPAVLTQARFPSHLTQLTYLTQLTSPSSGSSALTGQLQKSRPFFDVEISAFDAFDNLGG